MQEKTLQRVEPKQQENDGGRLMLVQTLRQMQLKKFGLPGHQRPSGWWNAQERELEKFVSRTAHCSW